MQINIVFIVVALFVIGAIFGSFGLVLISRNWDKKGIKSIFFGRSKCTSCHKTLGFEELIPVFSFWMQRGKCKSCGAKLSHYYWIVEVLMGIVFVLTYLFFPYNSIGELILWIIINWALVLLLIFDIQKYELHIPMWVFVTFVSLVFAVLKLNFTILWETVLAFVLVFICIYIFSMYYMRLRFRKKEEGFGQGDVFLAFTIGTLSALIFYYKLVVFSVVNLINIILMYVILSCTIGLLYAVINYFLPHKHQQIIPFVPSMIVAFWFMVLFAGYFINILQ